jgi:hypothetical protein
MRKWFIVSASYPKIVKMDGPRKPLFERLSHVRMLK